MTSVDRLRFTFSRLGVRRTPAVIDHLAFPHLVDLIFYYAPLSSLVLMGQTCREWRKRVKAELYHLRDFSAKRKPPWWNNKLSGSTSVIHHYQFTTVRGVSLQVTDTGYIRRCRVLDLGSRPIIVRPERVLRVDTLRISQTPLISINHMGRLGPFSCSRLVLDNHFALNTRREVRKLVVNHRDGNFRAREPRLGPECSNSSFKVHEFVFIVHPTADTKTRGMAQYEAAGLFHKLSASARTAGGAYRGPRKVIFTFVSNTPPSTMVSGKNILHRTLKMYRAEIGEEEFKIETNFDGPLSP